MSNTQFPPGSDGPLEPAQPPASDPSTNPASSQYDLAAFEVDETPARPVPPIPPARDRLGDRPKTGTPRTRRVARAAADEAATEARPSRSVFPATLPPVTTVWTRQGEWQRPLLTSAAVLIVGLAAIVLFQSVAIGAVVAVLMMGFLLVPAYALLTTLERPVRITAERAVKDYFESLNHHRPSFARMYLLLTDQGRHCDQFTNFPEFVRYWRDQLGRIKGTAIKRWQPLEFQVKDYQGDANPEKTYARVTATLEVRPRGATTGRPLAVYPLQVSVVKGPDGMWYLNDGVLPS